MVKKIIFIIILFFLFSMPSTLFAEDRSVFVHLNAKKENLRLSPGGVKIGEVYKDTKLRFIERNEKWTKVWVEGWLWNESLKMIIKQGQTSDKSAKSSYPIKYGKIELHGYKIEELPKDYKGGGYGEKILLRLRIKNVTPKEIKSWKARMVVKDLFNDELFSLNIRSMNSIKKYDWSQGGFVFKDNQFVDKEPYDILIGISDESLIIELQNIKVAQ